MPQSKRHSFFEATTNVLVGYGVAVGSQIVILPFFGVYLPVAANFKMGLWFTVVSLIRSYLLRRAFNRLALKEKRVYDVRQKQKRVRKHKETQSEEQGRR